MAAICLAVLMRNSYFLRKSTCGCEGDWTSGLTPCPCCLDKMQEGFGETGGEGRTAGLLVTSCPRWSLCHGACVSLCVYTRWPCRQEIKGQPPAFICTHSHMCTQAFTHALTCSHILPHTHTQALTHKCTHVCLYTHSHVHAHTCTCTHACMGMRAYIHTRRIHMCACIHSYMHTYTCTGHTHAHIHSHTHLHACSAGLSR